MQDWAVQEPAEQRLNRKLPGIVAPDEGGVENRRKALLSSRAKPAQEVRRAVLALLPLRSSVGPAAAAIKHFISTRGEGLCWDLILAALLMSLRYHMVKF